MIILNLTTEIGLVPKRSASTNGGEYTCPCPDCGGHDRFHIWPNQQTKNCIGTYWCRQCGKRGDSIQFCIDFLGLSFKEAMTKIMATVSERSYMPSSAKRSFAVPLNPPSEKWSQRALDFVLWAYGQIWRFPDKVAWLKKRGISEEAIKSYKLGYCIKDIWVDPTQFGITSHKKLFLPEGIVIPSIEPSGKIVRLKIRRTKWMREDELPKYWAVRGSMNGLNIVGDLRKPVMVVVESELDAFSIHATYNNLLFTVAIGSNTKNPDNVVDYWAKRRRLLICHDNDEGGLTMNEKWKKFYPSAQSCPVPIEFGKDIGEAIERGLNLNEWIKNVLN